jgi:L-lactate dehydrogenase complex protein LldG
MSGRERILEAISANKPSYVAAPEILVDRPEIGDLNLVNLFIHKLESIGGKAIVVNEYQIIREDIQQSAEKGQRIINMIAEAGEITGDINSTLDASHLESVHKAFIQGSLGVAENGAIWVKESRAVNRLLPFICQHLVLVINAADIVATLHEAYQNINIAEEGYGVFIAGPSKTADIEQSLVIGAHGARSLVVYLVE